jgi:hypothetical protein
VFLIKFASNTRTFLYLRKYILDYEMPCNSLIGMRAFQWSTNRKSAKCYIGRSSANKKIADLRFAELIGGDRPPMTEINRKWKKPSRAYVNVKTDTLSGTQSYERFSRKKGT